MFPRSRESNIMIFTLPIFAVLSIILYGPLVRAPPPPLFVSGKNASVSDACRKKVLTSLFTPTQTIGDPPYPLKNHGLSLRRPTLQIMWKWKIRRASPRLAACFIRNRCPPRIRRLFLVRLCHSSSPVLLAAFTHAKKSHRFADSHLSAQSLSHRVARPCSALLDGSCRASEVRLSCHAESLLAL